MTDPIVGGGGSLRLLKLGLGTWPMQGAVCAEAVLTGLDGRANQQSNLEALGLQPDPADIAYRRLGCLAKAAAHGQPRFCARVG